MNINQSSNEGNLNVLLTVTGRILRLLEEMFDNNKKVIISGDQLITSRVTSSKELRESDLSAFHRLEWAVPVLQLFHLQMLFSSTILRTHYGSVSTPGSLAFFISMLGIKRLSQDKPEYHAADQLIRNTFDAMVRRLWEIQLGTEQLEKYGSSRKRKGTEDEVPTAASKIRETYFNGARGLVGNANINAALFLRDASIYLELCSAIRVGDVGRVEKATMEMTIMFQAGGTTNYGNELLRLVYGIRRAWSPQWKKAVMSSWLINTEGKASRWIPADLYQEHNNLLIKTMYAPKGSNKSWETLANKISANVRSFSKIAATMEVEFGSTYNSRFHATVVLYQREENEKMI
jgi:hypothetical protein